MRFHPVVQLAVSGALMGALVGCTDASEVALQHRAEQTVQARGVALDDQGATANVGMFNTTCNVLTESGHIEQDFDFGPSAELVVDAVTTPELGTVNVILTPGQINLATPDSYPSHTTFSVPAEDARGTDVGIAAMLPDGLAWLGFDGQQQASVSTQIGTADGMAVDPRSGDVFIASADGVRRVSMDGSELNIAGVSDALVAWDRVNDAVVVAQAGGDTVQAFDRDGVQLWEQQVDGAIAALEDMGSAGRVALSAAAGDGTGRFMVLDGADGVVAASLHTPSPADELDVSGNGRVLAVTLPGAVHYFDILSN